MFAVKVRKKCMLVFTCRVDCVKHSLDASYAMVRCFSKGPQCTRTFMLVQELVWVHNTSVSSCAQWLKVPTECRYIHIRALHMDAESCVRSTKNRRLTLHSCMPESEGLCFSRDILHCSIHMYEHFHHYTVQKIYSSIQNYTVHQQHDAAPSNFFFFTI
jgi:hypothetical protein